MLTSVPSHLPHLQFPEFLKVSSLCTATKASSLGLCLKLESQIKENSNVNWSITLFLCFSFLLRTSSSLRSGKCSPFLFVSQEFVVALCKMMWSMQ